MANESSLLQTEMSRVWSSGKDYNKGTHGESVASFGTCSSCRDLWELFCSGEGQTYLLSF